MKKSDFAAVLFLTVYVCLVLFFPWTIQPITGEIVRGNLGDGLLNFGKFTAAYSYRVGFFKVGLLATFGEMLKVRVKTGS